MLEYNKDKGKDAELSAKFDLWGKGYETERTGRGHDYRARKRNILTGRVTRSHLVEVKSSKAKLSKLQGKTKKKKSNYKVHRVNSPFW